MVVLIYNGDANGGVVENDMYNAAAAANDDDADDDDGDDDNDDNKIR